MWLSVDWYIKWVSWHSANCWLLVDWLLIRCWSRVSIDTQPENDVFSMSDLLAHPTQCFENSVLGLWLKQFLQISHILVLSLPNFFPPIVLQEGLLWTGLKIPASPVSSSILYSQWGCFRQVSLFVTTSHAKNRWSDWSTSCFRDGMYM